MFAKGKTIISMLEDIRLYIMKKMIVQRNFLQRFKGSLCPYVRTRLEENKQKSRIWMPKWVKNLNSEKCVMKCRSNKYVVNLGE